MSFLPFKLSFSLEKYLHNSGLFWHGRGFREKFQSLRVAGSDLTAHAISFVIGFVTVINFVV